MADTDLTVRFDADLSALKAKISDASSLIGKFGDMIKGAFGSPDTKGAQDAFGRISDGAKASGEQSGGAFDKLKTIITEATESLLKMGLDAIKIAEPIRQAAGAFDQSTQAMSQIKVVALSAGLSLDALGRSFFDLQKKAKDGDEGTVSALKAIGLTAKDVGGIGQDALAVKMADAFSQFSDSSNKAAAAAALFGADVAGKLVPVLDQGAAHMKDLEGMADRTGTSIGPDFMAKIVGTEGAFKKFGDAIMEIGLIIEGRVLQAFAEWKPVLDGVLTIFTDLLHNVEAAYEWFDSLSGAADKGSTSMGLYARAALYVTKAIGGVIIDIQEFVLMSVQAANSVGLSFSGLSKVVDALGRDIANMATVSATALYTAFNEAIKGVIILFGDLASAGKAAITFDFSGVKAAFVQFGADAVGVGGKIKEALGPGAFSETTKAFDNLSANAAKESAAIDVIIKKLEQQRAAQQALINGGGAVSTPGTKKAGNPAAPDDPDKGNARAAISELEAEIQVARKALASKEELYATDVKLKLLSEDQKLAASKAALDQEYAAEKAIFDKMSKLPNLSAEQKQQANNKMKEADQKYLSESQKLADQQTVALVQPYFKMVDAMSSSLSQGIMGLIEHTQNIRQIMQNLTKAVTEQFVKMGVEVVADWVKSQISMVAAAVLHQGQITAAATAGAAARTTISAGEAVSAGAAQIAAVGKAIETSAAQAFAGVTAFLSPIMGPAAVGPAAATEATVLAAAGAIGGSYAVGSWSLPSDQIAMVHQGEMIVPAAQTPWAQSLMSNAASGGGSGGGGDTHNWNISVNGARSPNQVVTEIQNNVRNVIKALNRGYKDNNSLQPF